MIEDTLGVVLDKNLLSSRDSKIDFEEKHQNQIHT